MTGLVYLVALTALSQVNARVVELSCSDNATCINNLAKELARSVRQQKAVRLFDTFTLEPLGESQARGNVDPLTRLMRSYAISFDWNDYTFSFSNPDDEKQTLDLEVFESRSAKDVSEELPKKSTSKVEEAVAEDKRHGHPIKGHNKVGLKRRHRRKVLQAVFPMLFGMKSAGAAIFGLAMVTVLTLKAFFASKIALGITVYMAMKKFYESYGNGIGFQNHPYLYSQYPIDFPSATSHAYSVSGVSPQFASPEMYSPTALAAANTHTHEMLQQSDASAQQSQQAPTVLNSTRATERWDGKSKIQRLLEPMIDKIRSVIDPIATVFYDAMPATFRGLNSDVSTTNAEPDISTEEGGKKPREILVPQPRHIAQRKTFRKGSQQRPKKYTELKLDLHRLKQNKDLYDYEKTKKYKYNYPQTSYYPRIKYFVNPNYLVKPNNSRLLPYRKVSPKENSSIAENINILKNFTTEWKPIVTFHPILDFYNETGISNDFNSIRRKRTKRSIDTRMNVKKYEQQIRYYRSISKKSNDSDEADSYFDMLSDPLAALLKQAEEYTRGAMKHSLKSEKPPVYYNVAYAFLMQCLEAIDGLIEVHRDVENYLFEDEHGKQKKKRKKTKKPKKKVSHLSNSFPSPHSNDTRKSIIHILH